MPTPARSRAVAALSGMASAVHREGSVTVREVWRRLSRWWYIALPLAGISVAVTATTARAIPTEYQARSMISLLAASSGGRGNTGRTQHENPFLAFDPSITDTADLLTRRLDSPTAAAHLQGMGLSGSYAAALATNAPGPFLTLSVTGTNPGRVTASLQALLDYTAQQLAVIQTQASVPSASMIRTFVVIAPTEPTAQPTRKLLPVAGVAIAGLMLAVLSAFLAESVAMWRRTRRATATG